MSDLLRLVSWFQTAANAPNLLRAGGWILGGIVLSVLWNEESAGARVLGFVASDAALCFGLWYYVQAPLEWTRFLLIKAIFLMLGMSRLVCKAVLVCAAAILSAIYFISPIDFIPDILIGLGWIDDALVAFGLISYAAHSNYSLPVPRVSAEVAADEPAWKLVVVVLIGTVMTGIVRVATL